MKSLRSLSKRQGLALSKINMNTETQVPKFASMSEVVMKKEELLQHLITNKAKHDVVLATAIAGYWDTAKEKITQKQKRVTEELNEWKEDADRGFARFYQKIEAKEELPSHVSIKHFAIDTSLGLIYPQDHSKDYDRAIRMMQASIYEEVQLSVDEFDSYVLNNWEWKQNFLVSNAYYVNARRSKGGVLKYSGQSNVTGALRTSYDTASDDAVKLFQVSGMGAF